MTTFDIAVLSVAGAALLAAVVAIFCLAVNKTEDES